MSLWAIFDPAGVYEGLNEFALWSMGCEPLISQCRMKVRVVKL